MRSPVCLPSEVRPVPGWPGLHVSRSGEVYGPRGLRKASVDSEGYTYISARRPGKPWPDKLRVHQAVLLAWAGPCPPGLEGRHRNGDKGDNTLGNLSWSTHQENVDDKYVHRTMPLGADVHNSKLTAEDVREIRRLWGQVPGPALAERFGLHRTTVWKIARGKRWGWLR